MPQIFSTSRAEAVIVRFPPLFYPLVIVTALAVQAYLPVVVHAAVYLDLPLLVVIYYGCTVRRPIPASLLGAVLGLAQDSLAHLALGVNGIAKTLIGYAGASFGAKMDAEHSGIRVIAVFVGYLASRGILYSFERFLLGTPVPWQVEATLLAAGVNALLALALFRVLDRFRRWI